MRAAIFLQLPQLDNDVEGDHENVPLAAAYLQHAAERAGEDRHYRFESLPAGLEEADGPAPYRPEPEPYRGPSL